MRVLAPLLLIGAVLIVLLVWRVLNLSRRIKGIDNPVLWLPRKERRAHARKLLKRFDDEYDIRQQEKLTNLIRDELDKTR